MSAIYIKNLINASSISSVHWTGTNSKPTSPSLGYIGNGKVQYLPLITKDGTFENEAKTQRFSFDASAMSTIHVRYNGTEYVVPNKVVAIVKPEIVSTSQYSTKIGSGSSGYYSQTFVVTYKANGYASVGFGIITNGLVYSSTTGGTTSVNNGTATATFTITPKGGNLNAVVTIYPTVSSSSGDTVSCTLQSSPTWTWSNSSGGGGGTGGE